MQPCDKSFELENLAQRAWQDYKAGKAYATDDLYDLLMPFCLRVCAKTCSRYISDDDEEAGIARMAMLEALNKYDPLKGRLVVYLGQVVRNRIIDFRRKEKHKNALSRLVSKNEFAVTELVDDGFFDQLLEDIARKQEIIQLQNILGNYGVTFGDLVKRCPSQRRIREECKRIALQLANESELRDYLLEYKRLPLKSLEARNQVNRKFLDRYRKFIIASALIHMNQLVHLVGYVLPAEGGDDGGR